MNARIDFYTANPDAMKAMIALEVAVGKLGLEPSLVELIKLRSSQINGCAFCVDMHTSDMRKAGETERRLSGLVVWQETPFFTARERAALAWTEALTRIADTHAPDAVYAELAEHFNASEMVAVTLAINAINGWNRLAIGFRKMPAL
ncbi:carboxymuconolactone decarboxylase family protein [Pseudoduganella aquatica]|jgi:AhpD family alkylhydroperoxidase|uniref:Carboxymuconolactone decarboxylase family protein n=1 Tax=Pseudoduganella aquatica TaxID=2660641 RepID=A0A7X4H9C2_9BURK|nr:carboxymuconolactone decarboxylase family protein [Pseudoduganella aquatica]MYN06322.1 carboxymuconolactone decarboxylase family protein [Pseudoduganella aquatica]